VKRRHEYCQLPERCGCDACYARVQVRKGQPAKPTQPHRDRTKYARSDERREPLFPDPMGDG